MSPWGGATGCNCPRARACGKRKLVAAHSQSASHGTGSIRDVASGHVRLLEPETLVGRAPSCALRLAPRYVSGQHALLRWAGTSWELKDLGSRNGTFANGVRLRPGRSYPLRRGARIAFGKPAGDQWELLDESGPAVMAVPVGGGGEPVVLERELLALPSAEDPRVTIYRSTEGHWVLERPDEGASPLVNLQVFEVGDRLLAIPGRAPGTCTRPSSRPRSPIWRSGGCHISPSRCRATKNTWSS